MGFDAESMVMNRFQFRRHPQDQFDVQIAASGRTEFRGETAADFHDRGNWGPSDWCIPTRMYLGVAMPGPRLPPRRLRYWPQPTKRTIEWPQQSRRSPVFREDEKPTAEQTAWFEEFWPQYGLRKAKKLTFAAFCKHVKTPERFAEVIAAVAAQGPETGSRQPRHRPLAASWLNAGL